MAKVIRPFTHIKVKTLANRVRNAVVLSVNGNEISARIGSATNGTAITVTTDPERPRKFIEGTSFTPYAATVITTTAYTSAFCSPGGQAANNGYVFNTETGICYHPGYGDPFSPPDIGTVTNYQYLCPNGGVHNGIGMCVAE